MRKAILILLLLATMGLQAGDRACPPVSLTIHIRGVHETKVTLMTTMTATGLIQPILTEEKVKNGASCCFTVPADYLPGEFVLRFDYKQEASSTPYPAEKGFIINQQDLVLYVNPVNSNNPDSTWFQEGEVENSAIGRFMKENYAQKEMLGLLQNFLLNYDDPGADFYAEGIREYEIRRKEHNQWISAQIKTDRDLFVSTLYNFQFVPEINWKGTASQRKQSYRENYFDLVDFQDSLLIRARDMKSWMDQYVNLFGEQATTTTLRDSLFTLAGKQAIEKVRRGHPLVYGWMVDYFYKGYESFGIDAGIAMLEPYLNDPNCRTTKRQAIEKRLEGMRTLVKGTVVPDFSFPDPNGQPASFLKANPGKPYKLILFWSADCSHCMELVSQLYNWWKNPVNGAKVEVYAISLDETETEVAEYRNAVQLLKGWNHVLTQGGVNSAEAASYYILATPVMILVSAADNTIAGMPADIGQLESALR